MREPSAPITRWHGTTIATGFRPLIVAHRPRGRWPPELSREVRVGDGRAGRNSAQRCPYLLLKGRAPCFDSHGVDRLQLALEIGADPRAHSERVEARRSSTAP